MDLLSSIEFGLDASSQVKSLVCVKVFIDCIASSSLEFIEHHLLLVVGDNSLELLLLGSSLGEGSLQFLVLSIGISLVLSLENVLELVQLCQELLLISIAVSFHDVLAEGFTLGFHLYHLLVVLFLDLLESIIDHISTLIIHEISLSLLGLR